MAHYNKGANAERELIRMLFDRGLAVLRVAGSGKTSLPAPDVFALKPGLQVAIECKAWNKAYLNISNAQMGDLFEWGRRAGAKVFVAWKVPHKGWFFLKPEQFSRSSKFYNITLERALVEGVGIDSIFGLVPVSAR